MEEKSRPPRTPPPPLSIPSSTRCDTDISIKKTLGWIQHLEMISEFASTKFADLEPTRWLPKPIEFWRLCFELNANVKCANNSGLPGVSACPSSVDDWNISGSPVLLVANLFQTDTSQMGPFKEKKKKSKVLLATTYRFHI